MEIRVFDHQYNVVTINQSDVVSQVWVKNHYEYHTLTSTYHGASNSKEEAELKATMGFFEVKTKIIINMNYIERFVNDGIVINGVFYKLSRERLADLKVQLRKYIRNSQ